MTSQEFIASLEAAEPDPSWSHCLAALWWDKKNHWEQAHSIVQSMMTPRACAIHAYLHRKEGVLWNAEYWYARADRAVFSGSLDEEWLGLVVEILEKPHEN